MSRNILFGFTGILILLGFSLFLLKHQPDKVDDVLFSYIDSAGLEKIEITKNGNFISLSNDKSLNQWIVKTKASPQLIADADRIVRLLDKINESKVLQKVTNKKEHFDRFEVSDKTATVISIKRQGKEDITLYLGKPKDFSSQFVRKGNNDQIYLISNKFDFKIDLDQWMHKKIKLEKQKLSAIDYQTKDKKKVHLNYDASNNKLRFKGSLPEKKKLRDLPTLAEKLTTISIKGVEPADVAKKGKPVGQHSLTLNDKTIIGYKLIEATEKKDLKRYFLSLNIKHKDKSSSPFVEYLASLSKSHVFELYSIPTDTFQKKWEDFFEEVKDSKKSENKPKS